MPHAQPLGLVQGLLDLLAVARTTTSVMLRSGVMASWVARTRSASLEFGPETMPTSTRSIPVFTNSSEMTVASLGPEFDTSHVGGVAQGRVGQMGRLRKACLVR